VRIGDEAARISYVMMLAVALLLPLVLVSSRPWVLLVLLLVPLCLLPSWTMLKTQQRNGLIPVLQQTGMINLGFAAAYGLGLVLGKVV
jgi:1,4-dihydroxy-2-naphthoate octaprenyltransferase